MFVKYIIVDKTMPYSIYISPIFILFFYITFTIYLRCAFPEILQVASDFGMLITPDNIRI